MNLFKYIKEKTMLIVINILLLIFIVFLYYLYNVHIGIIMTTFVLWLIPIATFLASDYIKKTNYYNEVIAKFESLDKKYLVTEVIEAPAFLEGRAFYDLLKESNRCMHEHVNTYKILEKEYREYIETWVHEVKTPISAGKLLIENNKNEITLSLLEELNQIEKYVEEALYYARSNSVAEDYIIKSFPLRPVVNEVIKKNYSLFRQKKIQLEVAELEDVLFSDSKWVQFILNQILVNAIMYSKDEGAKIKIYTKETENSIELFIEDNGIGINERDLPMVFKKGFTGTNGRLFKRATGIGLYLTKKLCDKLGIGIDIHSSVGEGTILNLVFPKNNMIQFKD